jgi:hypothetical protein
MKRLFVLVLIVLAAGKLAAQQSFLENQKMFPKVGEAFREKEELLKKEFEKKGLTYPAKYIFVRSFKLDSEMEIWVKNNAADTFRLFTGNQSLLVAILTICSRRRLRIRAQAWSDLGRRVGGSCSYQWVRINLIRG